jgi:hypothetical protein
MMAPVVVNEADVQLGLGEKLVIAVVPDGFYGATLVKVVPPAV